MTRREGTPPGFVELEHTADIGIRITAPTVHELFRSAAAGTVHLVQGCVARDAVGGSARAEGARVIEIGSTYDPAEQPFPEGAGRLDGVDLLLARWLDEILYLLEVERFEYVDAEFSELSSGRLKARVFGLEDAPAGEREIKGVTYHGLGVISTPGGLTAQVIFDL